MKGHGIYRKQGLALAPSDRAAREMLATVNEGATVMVQLWTPRNMAQHRKFFAILGNVVEASGRWTSVEHLRRDVLIALGRYEDHVSQITGEITKVAHSMAVASMPRAEFERLYDDTIKLLTEALGADPEMLLQAAA